MPGVFVGRLLFDRFDGVEEHRAVGHFFIDVVDIDAESLDVGRVEDFTLLFVLPSTEKLPGCVLTVRIAPAAQASFAICTD